MRRKIKFLYMYFQLITISSYFLRVRIQYCSIELNGCHEPNVLNIGWNRRGEGERLVGLVHRIFWKPRVFTVHISRNSATTSRWLFRGESRVVERARANCTGSAADTRACIFRKINLPGSRPGCIYTWTVRSNRSDVGNLTLRTRKCLH